MKIPAAAAWFLAGLLVSGLAACENGPKMADLAPKIPDLNPEVPETRHPDRIKQEFPNINNAPDRPSVVHSTQELEEMEKSLEEAGGTHVNEAVGAITGKSPQDVTDEDAAAEDDEPAGVSTPAEPAPKPLDPTPPDDPT